MPRMKRLLVAGVVVAGLVVGSSAQQQQPARTGDGAQSGRGGGPPEQGQQVPDGPLPQGGPEQPTFRGGINFVRVDAIITDRRGQPVTDLKQEEFEVTEDGKPQAIEQFRLIKVDDVAPPPGEIARPIRSTDDEQREANRDDVRVYVFFLDDYHTRLENSMSVREPLTKFVETQLRPQDMVAVMYPLTPVRDLTFTRNHDAVLRAIRQFEGRKFDYNPRNQFEYEYWRYPTETVERIRNDVVMSALEGLAVRLGGLGEKRKSIVFVSEGFTAMLPPQMRHRDASVGANPFESQGGSGDSQSELRAEWFAEADVMQRMREVYTAANRGNASIYALDPRGLTAFEYGLGDQNAFSGSISMANDRRALQRTQDTLRVLSDETDGRAIVNRNTLAEGLAQITRDSSYYYLIGYTSTGAPTDGKFHEIKVRVKRGGTQVRARRGYWALTATDVKNVTERRSAPEVARPIQQALASIAPSVRAGKYVQTWVGTERGENGKTRVTLVWEPLPIAPGTRREAPGRVTLLAADGTGTPIYRGRSPEPAPAAPVTGPQRIVFDAAPGSVELRLTIEGLNGVGTLDQENRTIAVPDLTAPQAALGTPQVFRARNAREFQVLLTNPGVPGALREYSRSERLLIRFTSYGPGTERPTPTALLLSRAGQKIRDLNVEPGAGGATHQIDLPLNTLAAGEYLVEINVTSGSGEAKEYVPLRVGA